MGIFSVPIIFYMKMLLSDILETQNLTDVVRQYVDINQGLLNRTQHHDFVLNILFCNSKFRGHIDKGDVLTNSQLMAMMMGCFSC